MGQADWSWAGNFEMREEGWEASNMVCIRRQEKTTPKDSGKISSVSSLVYSENYQVVHL